MKLQSFRHREGGKMIPFPGITMAQSTMNRVQELKNTLVQLLSINRDQTRLNLK
ncbi:hypothetical protein NC652_023629 [Populus alba x Populus x berolinensis]|nr:hypothetical protein NC652_023629 [Populus alba x Populus x berolinensis]